MARMRRASSNSQIVWMARDTLGKRGFTGIKLPLDLKLMLLYYITDQRQFAGNAEEQRRQLLHKIAECAAAGVDYIQLREKDLAARQLEALAHEAVQAIGRGPHTRLLMWQVLGRFLRWEESRWAPPSNACRLGPPESRQYGSSSKTRSRKLCACCESQNHTNICTHRVR